MVDRPNKPAALATTPGLAPQPQVTFSADSSRVLAVLPTGESITVLLHGATVISWVDAAGQEKLWLSDAAHLDGSKAVRGGIPLVFPIFGSPSANHPATQHLPAHGFARNARWEFLGKSTSESTPARGTNRPALSPPPPPPPPTATTSTPATATSQPLPLPPHIAEAAAAVASSADAGAEGAAGSSTVKLDFGLSSVGLPAEVRAHWPYDFSLIYSVTLAPGSLTTGLMVTNDEVMRAFECQVLMHTYFRVKDISHVSITGLENTPYFDKTLPNAPASSLHPDEPLRFDGETDRVFKPVLARPSTSTTPSPSPSTPGDIRIVEDDEPVFRIARDNLADVVVWNPWVGKANGMGDFMPKEGYKQMVCVEAGAVRGWTTLEAGDAFEGAQTIYLE